MTKKKKVKKPKKKTPATVTVPPAAEKPPAPPAGVQPSTGPATTPYPRAGQKVTDFENKIADKLAGDPEAPPKRGPGRPRKDQGPAEPAGPVLEYAAISAGVRLPFDLWAVSQRQEFLRLADVQADQLARAIQALLDHYFPQLPASVILWANFGLISYAVLAPRLSQLAEIRAEKEKQNATVPGEPVQGPAASKKQPAGSVPVPAGGPKFPPLTEPTMVKE